MCNLYNVSPKDAFVVAFRRDYRQQWEAGTVGPNQTGVFIRPGLDGELEAHAGQWGMIRPGQPDRIDYLPSKVPDKRGRPRSTNNARIEGIEKKVTFREAWSKGRRCLIPAAWYQEPNWETGKNIWWQLKRADGLPWALAGLWSEWTDPGTGEVVPNFTMLTCNCDGHLLLGRLHKPDPELPPNAQDKRSVVHIDAANWEQWLHGSNDDALALVKPQPTDAFDLADARRTDEVLASMR